MILPNLKHLHYLSMLYKHQHFHHAAEACFISQSTLSSAIIKLEQQLDCQLLERDHKTFIFTAIGEKVVEMAQQLLVSSTELVAFAKSQGDPLSGTIKIGCIPTIAPFLLTDLIVQSRQLLPDLSLFIREDTTENLLAQLASGELDTVILALPIPQHSFISEILGKDHFYIAGKQSLVENFLQHYDYEKMPPESTFLLTKEHCLTDHTISACNIKNKNIINSFSPSSLASLVQMTAFQQGITFLPEMAVKKGLGKAEGLIIRKLQQHTFREIGMLWRVNSARQPTYKALANIIKPILT